MKLPAFKIFFFFLLVSSRLYSQSPEWIIFWEELSREGLLAPFPAVSNPEKPGLAAALLLQKSINSILSEKKYISPGEKKQLDFLIDTFRDDLFILEKTAENLALFERLKKEEKVSPEITVKLLSGFSAGESSSERTDIYLELDRKSFPNLFCRLRAGGPSEGFTYGLSPVIDELHISGRVGRFRITAGRFYFLFGPLGLISDNYFEAFDGFRAETSLGRLNGSLVLSRLALTNYPYRDYFIDDDNYVLARLEYGFSGDFSVGGNMLLSGLASEQGASLDIYRKSGHREFIAELAAYKPSETNYIDTAESKFGGVAGTDIFYTGPFNLFLQAGYIQKGFTPLASSLYYSSTEHLYFDQNTGGFDITLTYKPGKKEKRKGLFDSRFDRLGEWEKSSVFELEAVSLWTADRRTVHSRKYIARARMELFDGISFFAENGYAVNIDTPVLPGTERNSFRFSVLCVF